MNRDSFMKELEALLQDISAEERAEALMYYSDYFADAGAENEGSVIEELGSPRKVAETIKAGLCGSDGEHQEYRETGYTDTRFETKNMPGDRRTYVSGSGYHPEYESKQKNKNNGIVKVLLILAIIFIGLPIVLPLGIAAVVLVGALVVGLFALLLGLLVGAAGIAVAGVVLFVDGIVKMVTITGMVTGMMLTGAGLIIGVIGVVGTVLMAKVSWIIVRAVFRGIVNLCRKLLHQRKAV